MSEVKFLRFFALAQSLLGASLLLGFTPAPAPTCAEESTNKLVRVITKRQGEVTHFYVQNLEPSEVTATFDLKLTNLKSSVGSCYTATYPGNQLTEAFTVWPANSDKQWTYSYVNHFTMGSTRAMHDDSYVYSLPFGAGAEYRVTQGYNGTYSHTGSDQYAVDFKMPPG